MKRILVTGANKGIGLAIVQAILDDYEDTYVLLGSRNLERGRVAVSEILAKNPEWSNRLNVLKIDVSSDDSVSQAAKEVSTLFDNQSTPLYGLVNNAGIASGDVGTVLEVNTYGVRRVCDAFIPLLSPSQGRIINITSASGPNYVAKCEQSRQGFFLDANIEWSALNTFMQERIASGSESNAYGLSKACTNSYTLLLARENPDLRVNACTPGFIETDLTRPYAENQGKKPEEMGMKPPAEGAVSALFLLFGELQGNGRYYGSDAKRSPLDRYRAPGTAPFTGD